MMPCLGIGLFNYHSILKIVNEYIVIDTFLMSILEVRKKTTFNISTIYRRQLLEINDVSTKLIVANIVKFIQLNILLTKISMVTFIFLCWSRNEICTVQTFD